MSKAKITLDIDYHPAVNTPDRIKNILDTVMAQAYAVHDYTITIEREQ